MDCTGILDATSTGDSVNIGHITDANMRYYINSIDDGANPFTSKELQNYRIKWFQSLKAIHEQYRSEMSLHQDVHKLLKSSHDISFNNFICKNHKLEIRSSAEIFYVSQQEETTETTDSTPLALNDEGENIDPPIENGEDGTGENPTDPDNPTTDTPVTGDEPQDPTSPDPEVPDEPAEPVNNKIICTLDIYYNFPHISNSYTHQIVYDPLTEVVEWTAFILNAFDATIRPYLLEITKSTYDKLTNTSANNQYTSVDPNCPSNGCNCSGNCNADIVDGGTVYLCTSCSTRREGVRYMLDAQVYCPRCIFSHLSAHMRKHGLPYNGCACATDEEIVTEIDKMLVALKKYYIQHNVSDEWQCFEMKVVKCGC